MGKKIARLYDISDHGGIIITSGSQNIVEGMPAARLGDLHSCPLPDHGITEIVTASPDTVFEGKPVARQGDLAGCGARMAMQKSPAISDVN